MADWAGRSPRHDGSPLNTIELARDRQNCWCHPDHEQSWTRSGADKKRRGCALRSHCWTNFPSKVMRVPYAHGSQWASTVLVRTKSCRESTTIHHHTFATTNESQIQKHCLVTVSTQRRHSDQSPHLPKRDSIHQVRTNEQLADLLIKCSFTSAQRKSLACLIDIKRPHTNEVCICSLFRFVHKSILCLQISAMSTTQKES